MPSAFCFLSASTRFIQCEKCNHFFLILSETDSKRYIRYDTKAAVNEGDKGQAKLHRKPPPPPRKVGENESGMANILWHAFQNEAHRDGILGKLSKNCGCKSTAITICRHTLYMYLYDCQILGMVSLSMARQFQTSVLSSIQLWNIQLSNVHVQISV